MRRSLGGLALTQIWQFLHFLRTARKRRVWHPELKWEGLEKLDLLQALLQQGGSQRLSPGVQPKAGCFPGSLGTGQQGRGQ